jgi:N-acetylmuramoyl-L-alanine amidase-like protein
MRMIAIFTGMTLSVRRIRLIERLLLPTALCLATTVACHNTAVAPPIPDGVRFVPRTAWGAHAPVLPMTQHVPSRLTIHHTATVQNPSRTIENKMLGLQAFSQRDDSLAGGKKKPAWADVPYHYYVAVDGSVAEGREWRYVGDTNTEYNPAGHLLVVVEGNFEADTLTSAQRRTLEALIPALAARFHIAGSMFGAHRDFANTLCPGRNLYAEVPRLRALIAGGR